MKKIYLIVIKLFPNVFIRRLLYFSSSARANFIRRFISVNITGYAEQLIYGNKCIKYEAITTENLLNFFLNLE